MNQQQGFFHRPFWIRLFNWEYWSFNAVYAWVMPWWLWLSLKSRSPFFFSASNPGIENGGFLNESKKDLHQLLPKGMFPASLHFAVPADPEAVRRAIAAAGVGFPVMGKPDVGGRGRGIKKLDHPAALESYVREATMDFHIQAFVPYDKEVGIFYHRFPGQDSGKITGIVRKEFLAVTGDGLQSTRELLRGNPRGLMYLDSLEKVLGAGLEEVPGAGEYRVVSPFGNHARGSLFLDDTHLADDRLLAVMDDIARQIPGFYFGRLDIRFRDWESLLSGQHFAIIELNGAGAEPTHMYDPRHSIFFAWKEITRHWSIMQRISKENHARGVPYLSWKTGREMFRKDRELSEKLSRMPQ
jgi:hypothetical protein